MVGNSGMLQIHSSAHLRTFATKYDTQLAEWTKALARLDCHMTKGYQKTTKLTSQDKLCVWCQNCMGLNLDVPNPCSPLTEKVAHQLELFESQTGKGSLIGKHPPQMTGVWTLYQVSTLIVLAQTRLGWLLLMIMN